MDENNYHNKCLQNRTEQTFTTSGNYSFLLLYITDKNKFDGVHVCTLYTVRCWSKVFHEFEYFEKILNILIKGKQLLEQYMCIIVNELERKTKKQGSNKCK
jgi:hypothetical protein